MLLDDAPNPYDIVLETDEINDDLGNSNDIVNPSALENPERPIAGKPVLEVWNAGTTVVLKRRMATGYAGVQYPLNFCHDTGMPFRDAHDSIDGVFKALWLTRF